MRRLGFLLLLPVLLFAGRAAAQGGPEARIETSLGTITIALDRDRAPATVDNFVRYAKGGHFDGTVFYRVVPGFVIQAGSFKADGSWKPTYLQPIPLESGLGNVRGAVAMARGDAPQSATAEFFINLKNNGASLDPKPGAAPNTTGYAVFGHVTEGMDVVDKIAALRLKGGKGPFPDAAPKTPVVIESVTVSETTP